MGTARSESIQTLSESYTLALEPILIKGSHLFVSLYFVFLSSTPGGLRFKSSSLEPESEADSGGEIY